VKVGASTTLYQYDQSGHLLEETDGAGNPLADYIYLDGLPVATLSPGASQVYFLHDDRLGTPQAATDSSQNVVWSAAYSPFGEMSTVPSLIVQNLRLPGQEYDADTGLYHNGFRDYAPGWGRYVQSDPIGLAGGLNTYGYARANPVNLIDPSGTLTLKDVSDTLTQWGNTISDDYDIAAAQVQTLWVEGPSQYTARHFPAVHKCLVEAEDEAKKLYEESAPVREIYDLLDKAKSIVEFDFVGIAGIFQDLFKRQAATGTWGANCNPTDPACNNSQWQKPLQLSPPPPPPPPRAPGT
jgi:RHS repeat-associated protein